MHTDAGSVRTRMDGRITMFMVQTHSIDRLVTRQDHVHVERRTSHEEKVVLDVAIGARFTRRLTGGHSNRYRLWYLDRRWRLRSWSVPLFLGVGHSHIRLVALQSCGRVTSERPGSLSAGVRPNRYWGGHLRQYFAALRKEPVLEKAELGDVRRSWRSRYLQLGKGGSNKGLKIQPVTEKRVMMSPSALVIVSKLRAARFRKSDLSFENAISMGFRSGE